MDKKDKNPIISLIVRNPAGEVLIGIRNPDTNTTHPNVVSTPTMRITRCLADNILREIKLVKTTLPELNFPSQETDVYKINDSCQKTYHGHEENSSNSLIYAAATLFTNKLCANRPSRFSAHLISVIEGILLYDKSEALPWMSKNDAGYYYEEAQMIGVEVALQEVISFKTDSYSHLAFVPEEKFREMVRIRSIEPVADALGTRSPFYCVKGMCLQAAYVALRGKS